MTSMVGTAAAAVNRNFPADEEWRLIMQTAAHVWKSGMASDYGIKSESAVILVMLKGWELGLPLMGSMEHVRIIHGRVSISAECQQALVLARVAGARFRWLSDGRNGKAEVLAVRPGHEDVKVAYTIEDAQQGGVAGKNPTYRTWPANLLRAGAMRNVCRVQFPDIILGLSGFDDNDVVPEEAAPVRKLEASPEPIAAALVAAPAERRPAPKQIEAPAPAPAAVPALAAAPMREPGDDEDADAGDPEDAPLPFDRGRFNGVRLSEIKTAADFNTLVSGFRTAAKAAEATNDEERADDRRAWAERVIDWAAYRGVNIEV